MDGDYEIAFPPPTVAEFDRRLRAAILSWGATIAEAGKRINLSRARIYELTDGSHLLRSSQLADLVGRCAPAQTVEHDLAWWTDYWRRVRMADAIGGDGSEPALNNRAMPSAATAGHLVPFSWYWPERRTGEREVAASEIWIVSPDLYWDYEDQEYSKLVAENVARGVEYRYLYRENDQNSLRAEELAEQFGALGQSARAELRGIPANHFFWCAEHVLFDPHTSREVGLIVDIWSERDKSAKADIEMGRSRRALFRTQFETAWKVWDPRATRA